MAIRRNASKYDVKHGGTNNGLYVDKGVPYLKGTGADHADQFKSDEDFTYNDENKTLYTTCADVKRDLKVEHDALVENDFTVCCNSDLKGTTCVEDTLTVDKATCLKDNLTVDKVSCLKDALTVDKATCLKTNLTVDEDTWIKGKLKVDGGATITGDTHISGDLFVDGTTHSVNEEDIETGADEITLRLNKPTGLAAGQISGLVVKKYDGTHDLQLGTDNTGTLRVGTGTGTDTTLTNVAYNDESNKWYSWTKTDDVYTYTLLATQPTGTISAYTGKAEDDKYTHYDSVTFTVYNLTSMEPILTRAEEIDMEKDYLTKWDSSNTKAITTGTSCTHNLCVNDNLTVEGHSCTKGSLTVDNSTCLKSFLTVDAGTTLKDNVVACKDVGICDTLTVRNGIYLTDPLSGASFCGQVDADHLNVTKGCTNTKNIDVDGDGHITGNLTVDGDLAIGGDFATDKLATAETTANANYYLTMVDSNNKTKTVEQFYTSGNYSFNPSTQTLSIGTTKINPSSMCVANNYKFQAGTGGATATLSTGGLSLGGVSNAWVDACQVWGKELYICDILCVRTTTPAVCLYRGLIIDNAPGENFNEFVRLNLAKDKFAGIVVGTPTGSLEGITNGFWMGVNCSNTANAAKLFVNYGTHSKCSFFCGNSDGTTTWFGNVYNNFIQAAHTLTAGTAYYFRIATMPSAQNGVEGKLTIGVAGPNAVEGGSIVVSPGEYGTKSIKVNFAEKYNSYTRGIQYVAVGGAAKVQWTTSEYIIIKYVPSNTGAHTFYLHQDVNSAFTDLQITNLGTTEPSILTQWVRTGDMGGAIGRTAISASSAAPYFGRCLVVCNYAKNTAGDLTSTNINYNLLVDHTNTPYIGQFNGIPEYYKLHQPSVACTGYFVLNTGTTTGLDILRSFNDSACFAAAANNCVTIYSPYFIAKDTSAGLRQYAVDGQTLEYVVPYIYGKDVCAFLDCNYSGAITGMSASWSGRPGGDWRFYQKFSWQPATVDDPDWKTVVAWPTGQTPGNIDCQTAAFRVRNSSGWQQWHCLIDSVNLPTYLKNNSKSVLFGDIGATSSLNVATDAVCRKVLFCNTVSGIGYWGSYAFGYQRSGANFGTLLLSVGLNDNQTAWQDFMFCNNGNIVSNGHYGFCGTGTGNLDWFCAGHTLTGNYNVAIAGSSAVAGGCAVAIGYSPVAGACAVAIGNVVRAGACSVSIGNIVANSDPVQAVAVGYNNYVYGNYDVVIGRSASACGLDSIAIGSQTVAKCTNSIAIGNGACVCANQGIAIGLSARGCGLNGVAIGYGSHANYTDSVAIGCSARTSSSAPSFAIGKDTYASGSASIAIGCTINASKEYAIAIGADSIADCERSIAIGRQVKACAPNGIAIGNCVESFIECGYTVSVIKMAGHQDWSAHGIMQISGQGTNNKHCDLWHAFCKFFITTFGGSGYRHSMTGVGPYVYCGNYGNACGIDDWGVHRFRWDASTDIPNTTKASCNCNFVIADVATICNNTNAALWQNRNIEYTLLF